MVTTFKIGTSVFSVRTDWEKVWSPDVSKFIAGDISGEICYDISGVKKLPEPLGREILKRDELGVWMEGDREIRRYTIPGDRQPYAVKEGENIRYDRRYAPFMEDDKVVFSLLALEKLMLSGESLVLHSSYIRYRERGILFTAPSGTGKSTQADLWKMYRGASVINGDRSLLYREKGKWFAGGWPFSGSSTFCENVGSEIRAIVYLSQQPENTVRRCSRAEAVKKLISEITMNYWNPEFVNQAVDLIDSLASQVPFYYLGCRKEESAVQCLEQALMEE